MARFRMIRRGLLGSAAVTISYDLRWGTFTDPSSGWITFGLPGGCRRVWVDSTKADDSGNGLTAATAKKTMAAAVAVFKTGWTVGDQIMVAGGSAGGTYNDPDDGTNLLFCGGSGPSVMTVIQSYDRGDPTGATTPYGMLVGAMMPVFNIFSTNSLLLAMFNVPDVGYLAVKGIEIKDARGLINNSLGITWQVNKHPGMVYQNVRFNGTGISSNGTQDRTNLQPNAGLVSKCSQWNSGGIYLDASDNFRIQDFVSAHCGWDINSTRDDPVLFGGPTYFAHAYYLHAGSTNLSLNRIVTVDATDGVGSRCGANSANHLVSIDNPFGLNASGFSSNYLEMPGGAPWYCDDVVIMGSDKQTQPNAGAATGFQCENNIPGSYTRNVALFDNDAFNWDGAGSASSNRYAAMIRSNAAQVPTGMLFDKWSAWNYAITPGQIYLTNNGDLANIHVNWSNSTLEVLPDATLFNGTLTNVTTRSSAPAGYKTRSQVYAAMGYSTKSDLINAMLWRPDLPWAQALCGIGLPAMGLTPIYATVAPPAVITGAPVVYKNALTDLTATSLAFVRGVPKYVLLSGIVPCSYLSCADFPSGFSNTAYRKTVSGTVTSGSNVITGTSDTTGILPGMLVEAKTGGYAVANLFPAMSVVVSTTVNTITVSNNATASTGTSPAEQVFISCGGRMIRYDGSGSGAATPTIHILETPKDNGMTAHTTALTLSIALFTSATLSSPTAAAASTASGNIGVTTNIDWGTIYYVVTTSSTAPSATQIKAGQNNAGSAAAANGFVAVSAPGAKTFAPSGLTASTGYYAYFVHDNGSNSNVVSASFTTNAPSANPLNPANSSTDWTFSNSNLTVTRNSTSAGFNALARATTAKTNGTVQFTINNIGSNDVYVGFDTGVETTYLGHDGSGNSIGYASTGGIIYAGSTIINSTTAPSYTTGDVIKMIKTGVSIAIYKNGTLLVTVDTSAPSWGATSAPVGGSSYPTIYNGNGTGIAVTIDTYSF